MIVILLSLIGIVIGVFAISFGALYVIVTIIGNITSAWEIIPASIGVIVLIGILLFIVLQSLTHFQPTSAEQDKMDNPQFTGSNHHSNMNKLRR